MSFQDILATAATGIAALGGGAAIVTAFSGWLGKLWASRFLEQERAKHAQSLAETQQRHARELESLKSKFERELERYRSELKRVATRFERYDVRQFETYGQIWVALYDLRLAADALWNDASTRNLEQFTRQFQITRDTTGRLSLYIEDEHDRKLQSLLKEFGDFEMGKRQLRDLRTDPEIRTGARAADIDILVDTNRQLRESYNTLIKEIRQNFKAQLTSSEYKAMAKGSTELREDIP